MARCTPLIFLATLLVIAACQTSLVAQTYLRRISDALDERPNSMENAIDGGSIIVGTQKELPMG